MSEEQITVYTDEDISLGPVLNRKVSIIGYGNQGRAQALNLRESGVDVVIGLRPKGPTRVAAEHAGFQVLDIADAAREGDIVALLVPDEFIPEVFNAHVKNDLKDNSVLLFAHGVTVHFGTVRPDETHDIVLVAPMGPGKLLRRMFTEGTGLNAKVAVYQDVTGEAWDVALSYAKAIGCGRAGIIATTFASEAILDLFSEQAVLCGGLPALAEAAFLTLVKAGYPPALAYIECVREIKYVADIIYESGLSGLREQISLTALYGGLTRGPRLINDEVKKTLSKILEEIRNGGFYSEITSGKIERTELLSGAKNGAIEKARAEYEALSGL